MRLSSFSPGISLLFLLAFCCLDYQVEARGGRGGGGRGGGGRGGGSRGGSRGSSGSRGGSSSGWGRGGGGGRSSSGGWGGNRARVHSYRGGGGSLAARSAVPLVTRAAIGRSFFTPRTSTLLFMTAGGMSGMRMGHMMNSGGIRHRGGGQATQPNEDTAMLLDVADDNSTAVAVETGDELIPQEEALVIAHPELPVLVAPTLAYFWGSSHLPNATNELNGCVEMKTANEQGMYKLCNVSTMNRCQRPSSEVPDFIGRNITFQDGTPVRELAWLCPAAEGCCEWECCEVTYEGDESWMEWGLVFILVIFFLAVAGKRLNECMYERRMRRNMNQYQAGQPQRANEGIQMNTFK